MIVFAGYNYNWVSENSAPFLSQWLRQKHPQQFIAIFWTTAFCAKFQTLIICINKARDICDCCKVAELFVRHRDFAHLKTVP